MEIVYWVLYLYKVLTILSRYTGKFWVKIENETLNENIKKYENICKCTIFRFLTLRSKSFNFGLEIVDSY